MTSTSTRPASGTTAPRPVPAHVELLIAFTNTEDHELNTDDLTTRQQLAQWLFDRGLLRRRIAATDDDLALARQLRAEPLEALVIGLGQLDVEVVGDQTAVAGEDLRVVVALALECRSDLDGLHRRAEGPGERARDHLLELVLQTLEPAHVAPLPSLSPVRPGRAATDRIGVHDPDGVCPRPGLGHTRALG